jgi:hypothetical protein
MKRYANGVTRPDRPPSHEIEPGQPPPPPRPGNGEPENEGNGGPKDEGYDAFSATDKPQILPVCYHIHTLDEIAKSDGKPPPWVIKDLLPENGLMTISGRAKGCKTWSMLDLAVAKQGGHLWLGMETKPGPVVYINLENLASLNARVKNLLDHYQMPIDDLRGKFVPISIDCGKIAASCPEVLEDAHCTLVLRQIEQAVEQARIAPQLTIVDSHYKLMGNGDENSASAVERVYSGLRELGKRLSCAIINVHHFAKGAPGEKMQGDRAAGSRVHRQAPDTYVELAPLKEEIAVAFSADLRDYPPMKKFALRWKWPVLKLAPDLDPNDLLTPPSKMGRPKEHTTNEVVELLREKPLTSGEWYAAAKEACIDVSPRTFDRLKASAIRTGRVKKNDRYFAAV